MINREFPKRAYRGRILFLESEPPVDNGDKFHPTYFEDGILLVEGKKIVGVGSANDFQSQGLPLPPFNPSSLILPTFCDSHTHFPQMRIIGSHGKELLDWLQGYTYEEEAKFQDATYGQAVAQRFVEEQLRNGTTLSAVYSSIHESASESLLTVYQEKGLRAIVGKVSMDTNVPKNLQTQAKEECAALKRLIKKWHEKDGRLFIALTPRFAPVCSRELLKDLGLLKREVETLFVQTHHGESVAEVQWVKDLFPEFKTYGEVYDGFRLLGSRTILGHSIHMEKSEWSLFRDRGVSIAHCPTSNMFLGSGHFPIREFIKHEIPVSLASDIGAGTSFSPWKTMLAAYQIQKLLGRAISPAYLLYLATLGGAKALQQENVSGVLSSGKEADFQILDLKANPMIFERFANPSAPVMDLLACLMTLGDERLTSQVFVRGQEVFCKDPLAPNI